MANAHSLIRFNDLRHHGVEGDFYRNGTLLLDDVFDGSRLVFAKMPPTIDVDIDATQIADHLFIAGGGTLKKVSGAGTVTNWGIEPPVDGFTATKNTAGNTVIDSFDSAGSWNSTDASLANEGTIKLEGSNSMQMTVAKKAIGVAEKAITVDLAQVGTQESSDADIISIFFRANRPERIDQIQIEFDLGTSFATDFYSRTVAVEATKQPRKKKGLASLKEVQDIQTQFIGAAAEDELSPQESDNLSTQLGTSSVPVDANVWVNLRIPKLAFTRSGTNTALTWADVSRVRLTVKANARGQVVTYWDDGTLNGGAGLQGRYRYYVTFLNDNTGSRSNPNPTYVEVEDVDRSTISLAGLPNSADAQVTHLEIWRTMGDGSFFFFVDKITIGQLTYEDSVSDYFGFGLPDADVLQDEELQFDNTKPSSTFEYCAGPHQGRMWWCGDTESGKGGRVYYSPAGRAEGVKLFIDVTSSDDQTQALAIWNGSIYCFAQSGIFEILGTDEPFVARRIFGAPGTNDPHTVIRTPGGVVYRAHDGVRIFQGQASVLLHFDAVNKIMRGETVEDIAGFAPVFATYGRDEVYLGDAVVTLACNLPEGRWRNCGIAANAMNYEEDTGALMAAFNNKVLAFEQPNEPDDDGDAIPFEVKTPATLLDPNQQVRVGLIVVDMDPNGQTLQVYVEIDGVEEVLGIITGASRDKFELPLDRSGRVCSVRIEGDLTAMIEIFHIKARFALGGKSADIPMIEPMTPYRMLWLSYGNDVTPRFGLLRAKSVNALNTQTIRSRPGSTILFDTATGNIFKNCGSACPSGQFAQAVRDEATMFGGPAIRIPSNATETDFTGYVALYNSATGVLSLVKFVNEDINTSQGTAIASVTMTLAAADVWKISSITDNNYEVSVNNVVVISETDTDISAANVCTGWVDLLQFL